MTNVALVNRSLRVTPNTISSMFHVVSQMLVPSNVISTLHHFLTLPDLEFQLLSATIMEASLCPYRVV